MTTKIQILSDLHTEFGLYEPKETDADVVVLAGDIGVGRMALTWAGEFIEKPCVMVLGNHEHYRQKGPDFVDMMLEHAEKYPHLHLLENNQVEIDGVRFLGCALWTDFSCMGDRVQAAYAAQENLNDFQVIRTTPDYRKLRPADTIRWHEKSVAWLRESLSVPHNSPTVVVTHHAPSAKSIHPRYKGHSLSGAFASNLDDLVDASGAALWVHGHMHDSVDYQIGNTRVVCNPRGYCPEDLNREFDPRMVVEV